MKAVILGVIVLILITSGCTSDNSQITPENIETNNETPNQTIDAIEESKYKIGDIVEVDGLSYTVTKAESFTKMGSEKYQSTFKTTDEKFVKIYMEVINNSGESKNIGSNNLVLIDSKGRRYETRVDTDQGPSINLSIWVADGFDFGSVVFSNSSIIGAQVFEVPRDSTGLKLEITKEDWVSEDKLIFSLDPVTDIGRDYTIEERLAT